MIVQCQAGHKYHDRKMVPSIQGNFLIYDYEKYMDFPGYCMGQDDVSRTIGLYGKWSQDMYDFIEKILDKKDHGLFLDVGSHIGWFSRLAVSKGYSVIGFEGAPENIELARINVPTGIFENIWFDKDTKPTNLMVYAQLLKMDIEGNERYGLVYFEKSFRNKRIDNAVIEITPVFNDSYPALIKQMQDWGYSVHNLDGSDWNGKLDFDQSDLWFKANS